MAEYTITVTAPEKMDLSIVSPEGQQLILPKETPVQITFDYEKDTLIIFQYCRQYHLEKVLYQIYQIPVVWSLKVL